MRASRPRSVGKEEFVDFGGSHLGTLGLEQEAKPVVEPDDAQCNGDAEGAEGLDIHTNASDTAKDLGTNGVQGCLEQDHQDGDNQDG